LLRQHFNTVTNGRGCDDFTSAECRGELKKRIWNGNLVLWGKPNKSAEQYAGPKESVLCRPYNSILVAATVAVLMASPATSSL
jgi:hypothetical protein